MSFEEDGIFKQHTIGIFESNMHNIISFRWICKFNKMLIFFFFEETTLRSLFRRINIQSNLEMHSYETINLSLKSFADPKVMTSSWQTNLKRHCEKPDTAKRRRVKEKPAKCISVIKTIVFYWEFLQFRNIQWVFPPLAPILIYPYDIIY